MNEVIERSSDLPAALPSNDVAALIHVISKAASDPSVDVNKLERLMEMHERITAKEAERAFNAAMTQCQTEMKRVSPDAANPQTRSLYASYGKLDRVLRPIYTSHGFALSFDEGDSTKPEHVRVVCYVSHTAGHTRTYHRDMPADGKGAKGGDVMTKTHAAGAAGSYGARYLLKGIFNVAVGDEDDDGNGGKESGPEPDAAGKKALENCGSMDSLTKAWAALTKEQRKTLAEVKESCKARIQVADKAAQ